MRDDDAASQSQRLDGGEPAVLGVDRLSALRADGTDATVNLADSASITGLRPSGIVKRGRGRPRKLVVSIGGGDRSVAGENVSGVKSTGWLASVQAQCTKADGLTDGQLPVKLAQAVCTKADSMPVLDVVSAFEKCENMALKLKAAKFLKDTSKGTIEELRKYALGLMNEEASDEKTE